MWEKQKGRELILRVFYMPGPGLNSPLELEIHSANNPAKTILLASFCRWRNIILERSQICKVLHGDPSLELSVVKNKDKTKIRSNVTGKISV